MTTCTPDLVPRVAPSATNTVAIVVGSTIRQDPETLRAFLTSLETLDTNGCSISFLFVDDNDDQRSSKLLGEFVAGRGNASLLAVEHPPEPYVRDAVSHRWTDTLIRRVARSKDLIIEQVAADGANYLFFIDADLVLHPLTLQLLLAAKQDIVAEIFWTHWGPDDEELPQVWLTDTYDLHYRVARGEEIAGAVGRERGERFVAALRQPGLYQVGGLGACTLISHRALAAGVRFKELYNVSFEGEDRHFCIRAVALGFNLYVDTHAPAYHMYRPADLDGVGEYVEQCRDHDSTENLVAYLAQAKLEPPEPLAGSHWMRPKVTVSMIVRNEAGRYLRQVLEHAATWADAFVIIDDASDDNTAAVCQEVLEGKELALVENRTSRFANEIELRKQQWNATIATNPTFIAFLDADEMFEDRMREQLLGLVSSQADVTAFRLYDFWDEDHFREDANWCAHTTYRPILIRYRPDIEYTWTETPLHCGRMPASVGQLSTQLSDVRLKHLGWMRAEDRVAKFNRYQEQDPDACYGDAAQYASILDQEPSCLPWNESAICIPGPDLSFEDQVSRFVLIDDPAEHSIVLPLPSSWWSRPYEYSWALRVVPDGAVVLDAACGLSHPLKHALATRGNTVYALDAHPGIESKQAIITAVEQDFGRRSSNALTQAHWTNLHRRHGDVTKLPYDDGCFDAVVCISVLEHLSGDDLATALKEFKRTLRPGGMVALTFDFPTVNLRSFLAAVDAAGLHFAGPRTFDKPRNALFSPRWGLHCVRALLRRPPDVEP